MPRSHTLLILQRQIGGSRLVQESDECQTSVGVGLDSACRSVAARKLTSASRAAYRVRCIAYSLMSEELSRAGMIMMLATAMGKLQRLAMCSASSAMATRSATRLSPSASILTRTGCLLLDRNLSLRLRRREAKCCARCFRTGTTRSPTPSCLKLPSAILHWHILKAWKSL